MNLCTFINVHTHIHTQTNIYKESGGNTSLNYTAQELPHVCSPGCLPGKTPLPSDSSFFSFCPLVLGASWPPVSASCREHAVVWCLIMGSSALHSQQSYLVFSMCGTTSNSPQEWTCWPFFRLRFSNSEHWGEGWGVLILVIELLPCTASYSEAGELRGSRKPCWERFLLSMTHTHHTHQSRVGGCSQTQARPQTIAGLTVFINFFITNSSVIWTFNR